LFHAAILPFRRVAVQRSEGSGDLFPTIKANAA
jgi:hypothetical protein